MVLAVTCGAINWDISLFVDRFVGPGEEMYIRRILKVPGGTAANIAVAIARILGKGKVAFIGALGDDEIAKKHFEIMAEEGVDMSAVKIVEGIESGQAYILIDSMGRNIIYTYLEIKKHLRPEDIDRPEVQKVLDGAKAIVVTDPPLETVEKLLGVAKEKGLLTIFDPGVHIHQGLDKLKKSIELTDYFVLNHHEYRELLGTYEPEEVYKKLAKINEEVKAIIKMGEMGSALAWKEGVIRIPAIPLEKLGMKVINTVGCGDAFIGAFTSAKILGKDDETALKWGNAAGAFKATREETRGSPTYEELMKMLKFAKEAGVWK